MWIDNVLQNDIKAVTTPDSSVDRGNNIGATYAGTLPFNGSISDVRIYNRTLSATEIQNLYEQKVKSKDAYGYRAKDNVWYGSQTCTSSMQADDYYSGDGTQGITDSTSYWMCTAADCSTSCQVLIKDGLITGCT